VAWGGMWYVIADASRFGLALTPDEGRDIVRITELIKAAARDQLPVVHPEQPGFAGISVGQLSGPAHADGSDRRNAVTVSTREAKLDDPSTWTGVIDRSPCGTGTCAKMAILHARGELAIGRSFVHEGILGTTFTGRLVEETTVGPYRAVVPEITGTAWITGMSTLLVDPGDPYPDGYTVGDLW
jgi:proline racemase